MRLTVLDILTTPGFQCSRIIGGWNGLGRQIASVTVGETPDAADWLRGGELFLTTCYFLRENPAGLAPWMENLARGGAAAIAIKPQRFLGEFPDAAQEAAERVTLPLVSLPFEATWPAIIHQVSESILTHRLDRLETQPWRQELLWAIQERLGFPSVAEILAQYTNSAVMVHDMGCNVLASAVPGTLDSEPLQALLAYRLLPETLQEFAARQAAGPAITQITWTPPDEPPFGEFLFPLVDDRGTSGYLSVIPPPGRESQARLPVVEYTRAVMALAYHRLSTAVERERTLRRVQLRQFLTRTHLSGQAQSRLSTYLSSAGGASILGVSGLPQGVARAQLGDLLEVEVGALDTLGLVAEVPEGYVFLLHPSNPRGLRRLLQSLVEKLHIQIHHRWPGVRLYAGAGPRASDPAGYQESYEKALHCLEIARTSDGAETIILDEDLGVYRVLTETNRSVLQKFESDLLEPLLQFDREHNGYLVETVRAFFSCDCNVQRTANSLFVHPNTLRYRLKQVDKLTGLHLQRFEDQTTLWLALKSRKMRG